MQTAEEILKVYNHVINKKTSRIAYLEYDIFAFGLYHFPQAFTCVSAPFHKDWCKAFAGSEHLLIIAFRESAKSFWLMVFFIHNIVYRKRRNMFYVCYDKSTANERLFDIATHLQTNHTLLEDYGALFPDFTNSKN